MISMKFSINLWNVALFVNILSLRLVTCRTLHLVPGDKVHNDLNKDNLHLSTQSNGGEFEYRDHSDISLLNSKISEQGVIIPNSVRHNNLQMHYDELSSLHRKQDTVDKNSLESKLSFRNEVGATKDKTGNDNSLDKSTNVENESAKEEELSEIEKLLEKFSGKIKAEKANVLDARFEAITKIEQLAKQNLEDISKLKLGSLAEKEKLNKELQAAKEAIKNISNVNSTAKTLMQSLSLLNSDPVKENLKMETISKELDRDPKKEESPIESMNDVKFMKNEVNDVNKDSFSPNDVSKDVNKDAFRPLAKVNEDIKQQNETSSKDTLKDQGDITNILSSGLLELTKDVFGNDSISKESKNTGISSSDSHDQHLSPVDQTTELDHNAKSKEPLDGLAPPVENKPEITPIPNIPDTQAIEGGKVEAKEPLLISNKSESIVPKKKKIKILILDDDDDLDENLQHYVRKTPTQVHETVIYVPHQQYPSHNELYPNIEPINMQPIPELTPAIKKFPCPNEIYPGQHIHDQGSPTHVNCGALYSKPVLNSLDKDQWFRDFQQFKSQNMQPPYAGPGHYLFELGPKPNAIAPYSELHKKDSFKRPNEMIQLKPETNYLHVSKDYVGEVETRKNILKRGNRIDALLNQKGRNPNENIFTPQLESLVLQALKPFDHDGKNSNSRAKFENSFKSETATSRSKITRNTVNQSKQQKSHTKKQSKGLNYFKKPVKKLNRSHNSTLSFK